MNRKSKAELIQLVKSGVEAIGSVPKLDIEVVDVIATGDLLSSFEIFLTVRFIQSNGPFCCGEPGCYSKLFWNRGEDQLGQFLKREIGLAGEVSISIKSDVEYYDGIKFEKLH